jgi:hypothetical protein
MDAAAIPIRDSLSPTSPAESFHSAESRSGVDWDPLPSPHRLRPQPRSPRGMPPPRRDDRAGERRRSRSRSVSTTLPWPPPQPVPVEPSTGSRPPRDPTDVEPSPSSDFPSPLPAEGTSARALAAARQSGSSTPTPPNPQQLPPQRSTTPPRQEAPAPPPPTQPASAQQLLLAREQTAPPAPPIEVHSSSPDTSSQESSTTTDDNHRPAQQQDSRDQAPAFGTLRPITRASSAALLLAPQEPQSHLPVLTPTQQPPHPPPEGPTHSGQSDTPDTQLGIPRAPEPTLPHAPSGEPYSTAPQLADGNSVEGFSVPLLENKFC